MLNVRSGFKSFSSARSGFVVSLSACLMALSANVLIIPQQAANALEVEIGVSGESSQVDIESVDIVDYWFLDGVYYYYDPNFGLYFFLNEDGIQYCNRGFVIDDFFHHRDRLWIRDTWVVRLGKRGLRRPIDIGSETQEFELRRREYHEFRQYQWHRRFHIHREGGFYRH